MTKTVDGAQIILTPNPRFVDASGWENPLCVSADEHTGIIGCDSVHISEFRQDARELVNGYDTVVFIRLSEMMTPSNRTDDVWEFTFNQMETPAVSVDEKLFRSDPWRSWFHFGLVGAEYRDYTYSYLAETDYEQYFNGATDENPFSIEEISKWGGGIIESDYQEYFTEFEVEVGYDATPEEEYEYSELLDELFETKNTVGQVRRGLEDYADEIYPERYMPKRHQLFNDEKEWRLKRTNLPIDEWRASYLRELVDLTNSILEEFYVK